MSLSDGLTGDGPLEGNGCAEWNVRDLRGNPRIVRGGPRERERDLHLMELQPQPAKRRSTTNQTAESAETAGTERSGRSRGEPSSPPLREV